MKKMLFLVSLVQFLTFSNEIKLTLFQDANINEKPKEALIKISNKKEEDISNFSKDLEKYSTDFKFLNFSNIYEKKVEGYKLSVVFNKKYDMLFETKANTKKEVIEKMLKEVEKLKNIKLVSFNMEKIYSNEPKVYKNYLIKVKNLKEINEIIDLCKKYKLDINNPEYLYDNGNVPYDDVLYNTKEKAKKISDLLKYSFDDKNFVLSELNNENIENIFPMYYKAMDSNIQVPNKNTIVNSKVEYTLKNNSYKKLNGKIKVYGHASEYVDASSANITVEVNDDNLVEKLKAYGFKTKSYEYYKSYSDEIEQITTLELKPTEIKNIRYLLTNIDKLKVEANTRDMAVKKAENIIKEFKANGVNLVINNQSIKNIRNNKEKMFLSHILTAKVKDMEKLNEIFIELGKMNLDNISVYYEIDDKDIYIKALENAIEKLKNFKAYQITSIKEIKNMDKSFSSLPIKLTKSIEVEADIER
ncbi:hypothetical protein [Sneathia sanguinegens]|uniref:hypothetical protein n=1 Tax=Sneathia sanguinegens TaxID=40543 RepID=UPI0023F70A7A|nr:hypothetical protein [Sneathia sanguinegens]